MGWRFVGRMPYAPTVLPEKHAAFRTFHAQGGAKRGAMPDSYCLVWRRLYACDLLL